MIETQTSVQFAALGPVIEEYTAWFNDLLRALHMGMPEKPAMPVLFRKWLEQTGNSSIHAVFIFELGEMEKYLREAANIIYGRESFDRLGQEEFSSFVEQYEDFMGGLRRLERDLLYSGTGFDPLTGLRDIQALYSDYSNDLELLRRYDQPFSLVFGAFSGYSELKAAAEREHFETALKSLASLVRRSIRTFDEAYYIGKGEFIMMCKHTPKAGGTVVVTRLNKILRDHPVMLPLKDGSEGEAGMSFCVSEPSPGDDLTTLLAELRDDIGRYAEDGPVSVEHMELSPLQRYLDRNE